MLTTDIYVHSDKERNWELGERLGLSEEAIRLFRFACSEVQLTVAVQEETGEARIIAVDGRHVAD